MESRANTKALAFDLMFHTHVEKCFLNNGTDIDTNHSPPLFYGD